MRISTFVLALLLLGCANPAEKSTQPQTTETTIPDFIKARADSFIVSEVGPAFFSAYIALDPARSRFNAPDTFCIAHPTSCLEYLRHPHYLMVYSFAIPEKPWINELIEFAVDSLGFVILERPPYGIPGCVADSSSCTFSIDSSDAISIALQAGLESGIKPWQAGFFWSDGNYNTYVWAVSNTMAETPTGSSGRAVIIDSNSGAVYEIGEWQATPD